MAKGKHIRRSLGLGKVYNVRKMSSEDEYVESSNLHDQELKVHSEEFSEDVDLPEDDLIPPEVPERDYEVLQFDYIPPNLVTPCISPSRESSPNSSLDETTSSNFSCDSSSTNSNSPSRRSLSPTLRLKQKVGKAKFSLARTLVKTFSQNN